MLVLILNLGSSSIKYQLFDNSKSILKGLESEVVNYKDSLDRVFYLLKDYKIDVVGHRVVHGGDRFNKAVLIDDEVIKNIEDLIPLAPLHNPINLEGINYIKNLYPTIQQFAVFDTAFHQTMPQNSYSYAMNKELAKKYRVRKYGFHGISYSYLLKKSAKVLNKDINTLNLIIFHLGNGASVCAIENGKSINTSMGLTPLEGLVMGSRCGDIDVGVVSYLMSEANLSIDEVDNILNKNSGLLGLCGIKDFKKIIKLKNSSEDILLAYEIFIKRARKYLGAYLVELDRVDAVVFSGGIGENASIVREDILKNLDRFGISIDSEKNISSKERINSNSSIVDILVLKTDEELEILNSIIELGRYDERV
jgi:acetate kinase